jgi:hypothetical protein
MTALRFWAGWLVWPLAVLVVLGHLGRVTVDARGVCR